MNKVKTYRTTIFESSQQHVLLIYLAEPLNVVNDMHETRSCPTTAAKHTDCNS